MALSFRGGIHPEEMKLSAKCPIEEKQALEFVTIPLSQHIGKEALPLVKVGDHVCKGQKIGEADEGISCPVHASVSGKVVAIEQGITHFGESTLVTIENDFKEELSPEIVPFDTPISQADPEKLISHIREKGIVGMGGKGFPTWIKLKEGRGKVQKLIINCAESEPYLTSVHRLLLEKPEEIVGGVKILLRASGAKKAIFAIEKNKEDAIDRLQKIIGQSENFAIAVMETKYPQGNERVLIRTLTGKEVPAGKLPLSLGLSIFSAQTCRATYRAFVTGMPLISCVVTVSGECVKTPSNLLLPIGVSFRQALEMCGGFAQKPDIIVAGGPMLGENVENVDFPITKTTNAVIAIKEKTYKESPCIRCGRCVKVCPVGLMPLELAKSVVRGNLKRAEFYHITTCCGCGSCTYICPARIPLLENIKKGKAALLNEKKENEAKEEV
ncbi:MAG: electron transport complex subunit RsxC [Clostridia bacterium]|nr:electron transport complex subunit RsxC [Clostridia bacterium]